MRRLPSRSGASGRPAAHPQVILSCSFFFGYYAIAEFAEARQRFGVTLGAAKETAYIFNNILFYVQICAFAFLFVKKSIAVKLLPAVILAGTALVLVFFVFTSAFGFQEMFSPSRISDSTVEKIQAAGWCCVNFADPGSDHYDFRDDCPCLADEGRVEYRCVEKDNIRVCGDATKTCLPCDIPQDDSIFIANQSIMLANGLLFVALLGYYAFLQIKRRC